MQLKNQQFVLILVLTYYYMSINIVVTKNDGKMETVYLKLDVCIPGVFTITTMVTKLTKK